MFISVIISTYNRFESLKDTLNSLVIQECDGSFDYEIIIIDNNSKDKTKETVESYLKKFNGKLVYLFEPKQGKSYALNFGITVAKGEIFAFTDDDVIVNQNWLSYISNCFQKYNCDAIGGRILPLYPEKCPKWIKDYKDILQGPILFYDYGENIEEYKKETMLPFFGANMAIKKNCFTELGLFKTELGPGGIIGEDTEIYTRISNADKKIYYCGNVSVLHKVDKKRMNYKYISNWFISCGRSAVVIENLFRKEDFITREKFVFCFGVPRFLIRQTLRMFFLLLLNSIRDKRAFIKSFQLFFMKLGRIIEWRNQSKNNQYTKNI